MTEIEESSKPGTLVILAMFALAIAAIAGNVWYQRYRTARAIEYYGQGNAERISLAPLATLCELEPAADEEANQGDLIIWRGERHRVLRSKSAIDLPGVKNLRHALVDSACFDWNTRPKEPLEWSHAFVFEDARGEKTIILFSVPGKCAALAPDGEPLVMPKTFAEFSGFFAEQFGVSEAPKASAADELAR